MIAALRLWGREPCSACSRRSRDCVEALLGPGRGAPRGRRPGLHAHAPGDDLDLGFLFAAHAEGLLDDAPWLDTAFAALDRSPLGSASGYGVALPLDRRAVADALAFASVQENTLAVQNDRGKVEMQVLGAALGPVVGMARLAPI